MKEVPVTNGTLLRSRIWSYQYPCRLPARWVVGESSPSGVVRTWAAHLSAIETLEVDVEIEVLPYSPILGYWRDGKCMRREGDGAPDRHRSSPKACMVGEETRCCG